MNLVIAFLVYHYDASRKKQRFEELSEIIREGEKSIGLKRSGSFSVTFKKIKAKEIMENKFTDFLNESPNDSYFDCINSKEDNNILNKSDLYDYEIDNEHFGEKNGIYKFIHDINTDKIINKDNFGFGIKEIRK